MDNKNELIEYFRKMLLIRKFESKILSLFDENKIFGTTHVYIGEEAVAVGACSAITKDDYITSTHRGHGHFIAKGGDVKLVMAELFGKETGYSKGRGGTQHMSDMTIGHLGSNGITAGGIPIATGAGLAIKYKGFNRVVLCFFGDGACNEGYFHESLNFASVMKLPVVFICENNLYAMSTPVDYAFPTKDISCRGSSYNIDCNIVDGNDILKVKEAVECAVIKAKKGEGPTFIECKTYRHFGHSRNDPKIYRSKEEEKLWLENDPIIRFKDYLIKNKKISKKRLESIEKEVKIEIENAIKYADDCPFPDPKDVEKYLFCES